MTKVLNTTVHFGNSETGEVEVVKAGSKMPAGRMKEFKEAWGDRADEFFDDDGEADLPPEQRAPEGGPNEAADRVPADPASDRVKDAMKANQEARTQANPAGVKDSGKK